MAYVHFDAARRRRDLRFIREHRQALTLSLADEGDICGLIAELEPANLERASVAWIKAFANSARDERRSDYGLIVETFNVMTLDPQMGASRLRALCAERGLD